MAALLSGRRLAGIRLHSDTSGLDRVEGADGAGMVVTAFAGYVRPGAAWRAGLLLGSATRSPSLWLAVLLLGPCLQIRNFYGLYVVLVAGVGVVVVSWWGATRSSRWRRTPASGSSCSPPAPGRRAAAGPAARPGARLRRRHPGAPDPAARAVLGGRPCSWSRPPSGRGRGCGGAGSGRAHGHPLRQLHPPRLGTTARRPADRDRPGRGPGDARCSR